MNIYFIVEGKSEADVYIAWLSYLIPELKRVYYPDEVEQNNYYLFRSDGIPDIENDIIHAIEDINSLGRYNYFVICMDADAATVPQRETKILSLLEEAQINLIGASLKIIVQNRCIETWFLGNRKVYTRNPKNNSRFIEYSKFYNVSQDDPELMMKPDSFEGSISKFHFAYLKAMFIERGNMKYSKSDSIEVQRSSYLNELKNRVNNEPYHLSTFVKFLDFCSEIRDTIDKTKGIADVI